MAEMIKIADRSIGLEFPPFIIAEMSGNHNQSMSRAIEIVDAAARAGAHAIKLQTYTADTMTLDVANERFVISDEKSLWAGKSLHELYDIAHTPWEWQKEIFGRARELGLIPFSTPFDATAIEFLESLDAPCYKIASFEITDLQLIQRVAATGKPVIISTGMATISEIEDAVRAAHEGGCKDLILLQCTSTYPANPKNSNLRTLPNMRELFNAEVGLSDHTLGVGVAVASVALGATVIEKHLTLNRRDGGVDSAFSLEPDEMRQLVNETERAWQALGNIAYGPSEEERSSLKFRRSLFVVNDLRAGDLLTSANVRALRPGDGLSPKFISVVLGCKVTKDVVRGTPLAWELLQAGK